MKLVSVFFLTIQSIILISQDVTFSQIGLDNEGFYYFVATDFDNDGDADIVSYGNESGSFFSPLKMLYFENEGDITQSEGVEFGIELTSSAQGPIALDYDNDGDMDIVILNSRDVNLFTNDGSANFEHSVLIEGRELKQIGVLDIDGDLDWDVVAHEDISFNEVYLLTFTNDGDSNFSIDTLDALGPNSTSYQFEVVDLDGDGDLEIMRAALDSSKGVLTYYDNDGSGNYIYKEILSRQLQNCVQFEVTDSDGDGDLDIYVALQEGLYILEKSGTSYNRIPVDFYDLSFNNTFSVGDFNDDGLIDVFSSNVNFFDINNVYLNTGDGYFDDKIELAYDDQRFFNSQFIDMDMDGDLDILASGRHLILFENGLLSSTSDVDVAVKSVSIYPTVSDDIVNIESSNQSIQQISILDIKGRVVEEVKVNNSTHHVMSVAALDNGTYIIRTNLSDDTVSVDKFIKM